MLHQFRVAHRDSKSIFENGLVGLLNIRHQQGQTGEREAFVDDLAERIDFSFLEGDLDLGLREIDRRVVRVFFVAFGLESSDNGRRSANQQLDQKKGFFPDLGSRFDAVGFAFDQGEERAPFAFTEGIHHAELAEAGKNGVAFDAFPAHGRLCINGEGREERVLARRTAVGTKCGSSGRFVLLGPLLADSHDVLPKSERSISCKKPNVKL